MRASGGREGEVECLSVVVFFFFQFYDPHDDGFDYDGTVFMRYWTGHTAATTDAGKPLGPSSRCFFLLPALRFIRFGGLRVDRSMAMDNLDSSSLSHAYDVFEHHASTNAIVPCERTTCERDSQSSKCLSYSKSVKATYRKPCS